jgi:dolichol-phosphate mannosyltransferase
MSRDILVEALWRVTTWGVGERVGKVLSRDKPADKPADKPVGKPGDQGAAAPARPGAPDEKA